jgi:hypothetical protein
MSEITDMNSEVNTKNNNIGIKYFVILESILYFSFLFLDSINKISAASTILKFSSITVCLIFVFITYRRNSEKNTLFMLVILCFTVFADIFLLFTRRFEIGILSFIVVQLLYSFKIKKICKDGCKKYMIEVLVVAITWNVIILVLKSKGVLTPTIVIASSYFIIFTTNLIKCWILVIKDKKRDIYEISFALGLLLFYLCDINVGLNNLNGMGIQMPKLMEVLARNAGILIWFFYLPSQVVLSINGVLYRYK